MRTAAIGVIIGIVCGSAGAPAAAPQVETVLDNGLRVLVRARPQQALVSVDVLYAAGAAAEPDSLAGLAHLAEHLLCKGELRRRQALLTVQANASTSALSMVFTASCLPALLPRVLDLEADRMRGAAFDSVEFVRERNVVLQELAYRGGDRETSPPALAFRTAYRGHPFGRSPGGTPVSVARITLRDVRAFVGRAIHPGVAVLVVDGPVDPPAILEQVRSRFGALAAGPPPRPQPPYPAPEAGQAIIDNRDHEGYRVAVAVRVPLAGARDLALADLAAEYLAHERIATSLDLVPGEAVIVSNYYGRYFRPGEELAGLYPFDPDRDVQEHLHWYWGLIDRAARDLTSTERGEDLAAWLAGAAQARRTPRGTGWLPGSVFRSGVPTPADEEYARLAAAITPADLQAFLVGGVEPSRAVVAVSHGRDSGRIAYRAVAGRVERHGEIAAADALDGLTAAEIEPVLSAYGAAGALRLELLTLANGVPVVCRHVPEDPTWTLRGWRRFAPVADARPGKRAGICRLYTRAVGYDPRPPRDDRPPEPWPHDAEFTLAAGGEFTFAAGGTCAEAADVAAALTGRFDEQRFSVSRWTAVLRSAELVFGRLNQDAELRAAGWRRARLLGDDHPAVAELRPEGRTLERARYKDLEKLHRTAAGPTGATVLLACGGLAPEAVRPLLDGTFGRREPWRPWTPPPPPPGPSAIEGTVVPAPRQQDVTLVLGFPAVRPDPGWSDPGLLLLLLEERLDQALDSRLRQQEGWTYGVQCRLPVVAGWALPEIVVTCQPGQGPAVLEVVRAELVALAAAGFPPDRLALARLRLVGRLLRGADDPDALAAWLRTVSAFGPIPADPVAAVLALDPDAAGVDLAALLPADRFVFSATGAILEDDLELFAH